MGGKYTRRKRKKGGKVFILRNSKRPNKRWGGQVKIKNRKFRPNGEGQILEKKNPIGGKGAGGEKQQVVTAREAIKSSGGGNKKRRVTQYGNSSVQTTR